MAPVVAYQARISKHAQAAAAAVADSLIIPIIQYHILILFRSRLVRAVTVLPTLTGTTDKVHSSALFRLAAVSAVTAGTAALSMARAVPAEPELPLPAVLVLMLTRVAAQPVPAAVVELPVKAVLARMHPELRVVTVQIPAAVTAPTEVDPTEMAKAVI